MGKTTRITIDLDPDAYRQLCALVTRSGARTKAAAVRRAIVLFRTLVDLQHEGAEIVARKGAKEQTVSPSALGIILSSPRSSK